MKFAVRYTRSRLLLAIGFVACILFWSLTLLLWISGLVMIRICWIVVVLMKDLETNLIFGFVLWMFKFMNWGKRKFIIILFVLMWFLFLFKRWVWRICWRIKMMMMDEDGFNKRNILTLLLNFLIFAVSGKKKHLSL
jgi:hypothetical protein